MADNNFYACVHRPTMTKEDVETALADTRERWWGRLGFSIVSHTDWLELFFKSETDAKFAKEVIPRLELYHGDHPACNLKFVQWIGDAQA